MQTKQRLLEVSFTEAENGAQLEACKVFVLYKGVLESFLQERGLPAVVSVGHTQKFSGASPDLVPWGHSWWCSGLMPGSVLRDTSGGIQDSLYIWCQGSNPVGFESGRWHQRIRTSECVCLGWYSASHTCSSCLSEAGTKI